MKFTIVNKTIPLTLEINGKDEEYELREMDAASRDRYLDSITSRMRMDKEGKPVGVARFEGMQADLLVHTLRKKEGGGTIRKEVIQSWPASTVTALFEEAQKLNLLNRDIQEVAEETKNV